MLQKIRKLLAEKGQGVVEYTLLLGVVVIITVGLFGKGSLATTFRSTLSGIMAQFTQYNSAYSSSS